ncbi:hypothetical protein GCM10010255_76830 [Streptomyces coeruleofuscus]|uniref:Uncharacterized protein n=1 Tax=Streptomyces coeruleofuscus TaxID=66879 RepID=A0ABN3J8E3_9ACTN
MYVVGEPADSVPAASAALTYGAYAVPAPAGGEEEAGGEVPGAAGSEGAGRAASPCSEHAVATRATRQPSATAAGFR